MTIQSTIQLIENRVAGSWLRSGVGYMLATLLGGMLVYVAFINKAPVWVSWVLIPFGLLGAFLASPGLILLFLVDTLKDTNGLLPLTWRIFLPPLGGFVFGVGVYVGELGLKRWRGHSPSTYSNESPLLRGTNVLLCAFLACVIWTSTFAPYRAIKEGEKRKKVAFGRTLQARDLLPGLIEAEERFYSENGYYVAADPAPKIVKPGECTPWGLETTPEHGFNKLGWSPGNCSYCRFGVSAAGEAFTAVVECDLPELSDPGYVGYVRATPGAWTGLAGPFGQCKPWGIYTGSHYLVNTSGPCNDSSKEIMGTSVAAGNKVHLSVRTYPPGATVAINGGVRGQTPLWQPDPPRGQIEVVITKEGFEPRTVSMVLKRSYDIHVILRKTSKHRHP